MEISQNYVNKLDYMKYTQVNVEVHAKCTTIETVDVQPRYWQRGSEPHAQVNQRSRLLLILTVSFQISRAPYSVPVT